MDKQQKIETRISDSIELKKTLLSSADFTKNAAKIAKLLTKTFKNGKKVFFCGNGGSAADAQHLAAELSGRYYLDRAPLPAEALHVNSSFITAVANDYDFDQVYARMVQALGKKGDVLIALSTSGNSPNIIEAIKTANSLKLITIGMTGKSGGKMESVCQHTIKIPSTDVPRIQECHMLIGHTLCEIVEEEIFGSV